jgi:hypothetical protein
VDISLEYEGADIDMREDVQPHSKTVVNSTRVSEVGEVITSILAVPMTAYRQENEPPKPSKDSHDQKVSDMTWSMLD